MGQRTLIRKGFRQGGPAGFGLRRLLVDETGNRKFELHRLEHKSIQTDRVILVPGPEEIEEIGRKDVGRSSCRLRPAPQILQQFLVPQASVKTDLGDRPLILKIVPQQAEVFSNSEG